MDIRAHIPVVPDWPKPGVNFLDVTGLLITPTVYNHVVNLMSLWVQQFGATSLVAVESRGFLFASPIAKALALPLVIVRKPNKLPGDVYSVTYDTEYSTDSLSIKTNSPVGTSPCIIDDLIATGGTVLATAGLLRQHFAPESVGCAAVIGLDFLPGRVNLQANDIEVYTLVDYA